MWKGLDISKRKFMQFTWKEIIYLWYKYDLILMRDNILSQNYHKQKPERPFFSIITWLTKNRDSWRLRWLISQSSVVKGLTAVASTLTHLNVHQSELWSSIRQLVSIDKPHELSCRSGLSWAGQCDDWSFLIVFFWWRQSQFYIFWAI